MTLDRIMFAPRTNRYASEVADREVGTDIEVADARAQVGADRFRALPPSMILAALLASAAPGGTAATALVPPDQALPTSCAHGPVTGRQLLNPKLDPCLEAELPALAEPRPLPYAPAAPQGDDLQLWPKLKLVPAPLHDDVLLERLPGTLQ